VTSSCPICSAPLPTGPDARAPGVYFRGARVAFCGSACLLVFKRDPERHAPPVVIPALVGPAPAVRRSPFLVRGKPAREDL